MPKIDKVTNLQQLTARLLELAVETQALLDEVTKQLGKAKKSAPVKVKSKDLIALCTELAGGQDKLAEVTQANPQAVEIPTCKDLLLQSRAKLTDIRLRTGVKMSEDVEGDFTVDLSQEQLGPLITAYTDDTRLDGTWGGEMEAQHGASVLGFRCKVFVRANNTFQHVYTVGQGVNATFHLLHSGNHYEVIKHDIADGAPYAPARVQAIERDGDCLYNSLRNIAGRMGLAVSTRAVLRGAVAGRLTDAEVGIAIYSILLSGEHGGLGRNLAPLVQQLAPAVQGFSEVDSALYGTFAKGGKAIKDCTWWSQLSTAKGEIVATAKSIDALLDDARLVATIKKQRYGSVVGSGGTAFSMVTVHTAAPPKPLKGKQAPVKSPSVSSPLPADYACVASAMGEGTYEVFGRSSNADDHAEAQWFADCSDTLTTNAAKADCLFLEAHDTKAPCPEICTPRLYLIARETKKPLIVYTYGDWGHWQNNREILQKLFPKELAKKEWCPIMLFTGAGVFLVGTWTGKDKPFFFPPVKKEEE
jgi:hypothetical protein